jgi:myo-inositol-1(or 4)-monophosphatase
MDVLSADWRGICRRVVAEQRRLFAETSGIEERTVYEGVGEGGDHALELDRRCEDVIFSELEALAAEGASFVAVSEERGEVSFGDGGEARVVIDPIDGSLNARRTIPFHSVSIAVASGPTMADVEFGFVHDFGVGEEFAAVRGDGAELGGERIAVGPDSEKLEVLGIESAEPSWALPALRALEGSVYRIRVVGSIAITASYVAAGRFDAMLSLRPCRSVDIAAAQLIVREAGGEIAFGDLEPSGADLGIDARYPIAVAAGKRGLSTVRDCLETATQD